MAGRGGMTAAAAPARRAPSTRLTRLCGARSTLTSGPGTGDRGPGGGEREAAAAIHRMLATAMRRPMRRLGD